MTDPKNDIALSTMFFPVENGKIAASNKLAPILDHYFDDAPVWTQGIIAGDATVDKAYKNYIAVKDYHVIIEMMKHCQKRETFDDAHLYELLRDDCPVRPYFDLEWDAEQHEETEVLSTIIPIIVECLHHTGFTTCRGIAVYTASGACSSSSIPSGKKASFHVLFDTVEVFTNVAHHKQFVNGVLVPYINKNAAEYPVLFWKNKAGHPKLVLDSQPYGGHQTFRLPHQSKWVSGAARPLLPYDITFLDYPYSEVYTVGIYEDPAALTLIALDMKALRGPLRTIAAGVETTEYAKIAELCGCLSAEFLGSYQSTRNLIWMLWASEQTPRMRGLIHQVCQRGHNYCHRWVEGVIKGFKFSGFTVGSLVLWAREGAGVQAVDNILAKYASVYYEELFQRTMKPAQHTVIHERYLGDITPFCHNDTIMIHSHLGTGKTVTIRNYITRYRAERLLIISPRKSYTQSQLGIFLENFSTYEVLESYMDHLGPLSHIQWLIVQVESLHRVGEWFEPYDLVIMDESESILNQMHSVMTHGDNLINNHQVLELVMRTAKKVILADAFMTDRTFHFVGSLREPSKTVLIENTFQPYSREAILLQKKDSAEVNTDAFFERIMTALRAGRRIVVVWTSKRVGEEFEARFLKGEKFTYVFYHSDSTKEEQQGLKNVEESWRNIQCLMMTTSITVGISYDPVEDSPFNVWDSFLKREYSDVIVDGSEVREAYHPHFDEAFLYGSSKTALPRDIAQSLLRVRVLKANRLTYVIDAPVYAVEECGFTNVCNLITAKEEQVGRDHPLVRWTLCPKWARWNHTYNENERRCSCTYYKAVLEKYLVNSGYTLTKDIHDVPMVAEEIVEIPNEKLEWGEICDITHNDAEKLCITIQIGNADKIEKWQHHKYVFRQQFVDDMDENVIAGYWEKFVLLRKTEKFWNVVTEKRMSLEDMVQREARYRFAPMAAQRIAQREAIRQFMGIIGLAHSQQEAVLSHETLVQVGAALCAAEVELREGMGLRASRRKGEWRIGNTIDLIRVMLEEWGGGTMRSETKQVRTTEQTIREYTVYLNENNTLWDSIRNYNGKMDDFLVNI